MVGRAYKRPEPITIDDINDVKFFRVNELAAMGTRTDLVDHWGDRYSDASGSRLI